MGLSIKFKPQIIAGSRVIQVRVSFPIQTFVSFMVFDGTDPNDPDSEDYVKMPIFNRRSIDTTVQVYDGDTVLVGGVSTDLTKTYHDKIPILGDLPFVGRFFQSRYSEAEKGNILSVEKATLVHSGNVDEILDRLYNFSTLKNVLTQDVVVTDQKAGQRVKSEAPWGSHIVGYITCMENEFTNTGHTAGITIRGKEDKNAVNYRQNKG